MVKYTQHKSHMIKWMFRYIYSKCFPHKLEKVDNYTHYYCDGMED